MNSFSNFPNFRPKFVAFFEVSIPTGLSDPRDKQRQALQCRFATGRRLWKVTFFILATGWKPWKVDICPLTVLSKEISWSFPFCRRLVVIMSRCMYGKLLVMNLLNIIHDPQLSDDVSLTFCCKNGGGSPKISGAFDIWSKALLDLLRFQC